MAMSDFYICLSAQQAHDWQHFGCISTGWFNGSIPIKLNPLAAVDAFRAVYQEEPPVVAHIIISSDSFMALVLEKNLQVCLYPPVYGMRLTKDILDGDTKPFCKCVVRELKCSIELGSQASMEG